MKAFISTALIAFFISFGAYSSYGQGCPANEADLANGGTFSGNCTVAIGNTINITGPVIWLSGTLNMNGFGANGNVNINSGGSIEIRDGAEVYVDDGDLTVNTGGSITVLAGGQLTANEEAGQDIFINGGSITSAGTIDIDDDLILSNGGSLDMTGGIFNGGDNVTVTGSGSSLTLSGDAEMGPDIEYMTFENGATGDFGSGTSVTIINNLTLDDADLSMAGFFETTNGGGDADIEMNGNSNLTLEDGADVNVEDVDFGTGDGTSTITINGGDLNLSDDLSFNGGNDNDAIVINGGNLNVSDDIEIDPGSTITLNSGELNASSINNNTPADNNDYPDEIILNGGIANVGGTVLPVDLVSFKGNVYEGQLVELNWITASEKDNDGFEIERSYTGLEFEVIDFVEGRGTVNEWNEYQFIDNFTIASAYYRLKQIDFDGQFSYSPTIYVSIVDKEMNSLKAYPNPSFDSFRFQGSPNEIYDLRLIGLDGQECLKIESVSLREAQDKVNEFLTNKAGHYVISFQNPEIRKSMILIKY